MLHAMEIAGLFKIKETIVNKNCLKLLAPMLSKKNVPAPANWLVPLSWILLHGIGKFKTLESYEIQSSALYDNWLFGKTLYDTAISCGNSEEEAKTSAHTVYLLIEFQNLFSGKPAVTEIAHCLKSSSVQQLLGFNRFNGTIWFSKEKAERFFFWLFFISSISAIAAKGTNTAEKRELIEQYFDIYTSVSALMEQASYSADTLFTLLEK